jgi:hypothetical protein
MSSTAAINRIRRKKMAQYMVCDKAGETLKQNRFSDATFETEREAEAFRANYVAKQDDRNIEDYDIVEVA